MNISADSEFHATTLFLVLSLVVLGKTRHLLVDYESRVAVSASDAVAGRLTARMLWNGMNMIPVVVRWFGVVEEMAGAAWMDSWDFLQQFHLKSFHRIGKALSKRLPVAESYC